MLRHHTLDGPGPRIARHHTSFTLTQECSDFPNMLFVNRRKVHFYAAVEQTATESRFSHVRPCHVKYYCNTHWKHRDMYRQFQISQSNLSKTNTPTCVGMLKGSDANPRKCVKMYHSCCTFCHRQAWAAMVLQPKVRPYPAVVQSLPSGPRQQYCTPDLIPMVPLPPPQYNP